MSEMGLTTTEATDKAALMTRVQNGLDTWVEVGTALMELRDRKLWRDESPDFTSFCQVHFGFTKRRANQLISEADAALDVIAGGGNHGSQNGVPESETPIPVTGRHARELVDVPKEKRAETFRKAVDTAPKDKAGKPKVTAAHVRRVVRDEPAEPVPESNGHPEPEPDPVEPWQQTATDTLRIIGSLEAVAGDMRQSFGAKSKASEKALTFPGALRYSWSGTIGRVNEIVAYLHTEMPVGSDARGVVTQRDVDEKKAFAESRGGR